MPPTSPHDSPSHTPLRNIVLVLAVLVLVAGVLLVLHRRPADPQSLFTAALTKNLTDSGVTCRIQESAGGITTSQTVDLDLSGNRAHADLSVKQGTSTVSTEEIVTKTADYVRYQSIGSQSPAKAPAADYSQVLHVWGEADLAADSNLFSRTVLGNCIVPLAHLTANQAQTVNGMIAKGDIFKTDYAASRIEKQTAINYRVYDVTIQAAPYIAMMKQVASDYNFADLSAVSSANFSQSVSGTIKFYIDMSSGRLQKLSYANGQRTITLSNFNRSPRISVPTQTIPQTELAERFHAL